MRFQWTAFSQNSCCLVMQCSIPVLHPQKPPLRCDAVVSSSPVKPRAFQSRLAVSLRADVCLPNQWWRMHFRLPLCSEAFACSPASATDGFPRCRCAAAEAAGQGVPLQFACNTYATTKSRCYAGATPTNFFVNTLAEANSTSNANNLPAAVRHQRLLLSLRSC